MTNHDRLTKKQANTPTTNSPQEEQSNPDLDTAQQTNKTLSKRTLTPSAVLQLQRTIGNRATVQTLKKHSQEVQAMPRITEQTSLVNHLQLARYKQGDQVVVDSKRYFVLSVNEDDNEYRLGQDEDDLTAWIASEKEIVGKYNVGEWVDVDGETFLVLDIKKDEPEDEYLLGSTADDPSPVQLSERQITGLAKGKTGHNNESGSTPAKVAEVDTTPAYAEWEAQGKNKPNATETDQALKSKQSFANIPKQQANPASFRHITKAGNPDGKDAVKIDGGKVWAVHQMDYVGVTGQDSVGDKRRGGFAFQYEGENADQFRWLQFLSIEAFSVQGGPPQPIHDNDKVDFTVGSERKYGVDGNSNSHPYYDPASRTPTENMMIDDPFPSINLFNEKLRSGATQVEQTMQFDTFLVKANAKDPYLVDEVSYHGIIKVKFIAKRDEKDAEGYPIKKTSEILKSAAATKADLTDAMKDALTTRKANKQKM